MMRVRRFNDFEYFKDSEGEPTLCVGSYLWGDDIDKFIRWVEKIKTDRQADKNKETADG